MKRLVLPRNKDSEEGWNEFLFRLGFQFELGNRSIQLGVRLLKILDISRGYLIPPGISDPDP
jgi:hypothetical protein